MKTFTTFSEFKRNIQVGTKVKNVFHRNIIGRDSLTGKTLYGILDRGTRVVSIVQTNSYALKTEKNGTLVDSWFYYPKAKEVKIVNNHTLEVYEQDSQGKEILILTYQIED